MVVISHNLHDVFEVTDRIIVMRLGRRVRTSETRNTSREKVVASITGADQEVSLVEAEEATGVNEGEQVHGEMKTSSASPIQESTKRISDEKY